MAALEMMHELQLQSGYNLRSLKTIVKPLRKKTNGKHL